MGMPITVGIKAPDFTLPAQDGRPVRLSSYRDRQNVLLVFFPFAFSRVCTGELCSVRENLPNFQNDEVQTLAVSVDQPFALHAWARDEGYDFPLLSDFWPHGAVAQSYGVFDSTHGRAQRGTFIIDRDGFVRFAEMGEYSTVRDWQGWHSALSKLLG
jgi:peroxiredoxin (alkyl hydroperoxide reductase subunit C)